MKNITLIFIFCFSLASCGAIERIVKAERGISEPIPLPTFTFDAKEVKLIDVHISYTKPPVEPIDPTLEILKWLIGADAFKYAVGVGREGVSVEASNPF